LSGEYTQVTGSYHREKAFFSQFKRFDTCLTNFHLPNMLLHQACLIVAIGAIRFCSCRPSNSNVTMFAMGGFHLSDDGLIDEVDSYDFAADKWSRVANLITPRRGFGAASLGGLVYAVGGHDNDPGRVDVYDPAANKWSLGVRLSTPRQ